MKDKPRILIFTGPGKGKTTAAMGMSLRASGHNMRVMIIQFVKNSPTGEITAFEKFDNVTIIQTGLGFIPKPSSRKFADHKNSAHHGLALLADAIDSKEYDLIIADEICTATDSELITDNEVIETISKASPDTILVLTGRNATPAIMEIADTVSEIIPIKHGYESGFKAQKGVEF
ncbi:MAG: cob(I)yrinic acid a,c-diamide adenosyltransferase [Anaerohalosphaera sp.]|nr:cob(I)yrinic acid a,c-diamide adenosyltransferase [Anaerohalosphaera sp.]